MVSVSCVTRNVELTICRIYAVEITPLKLRHISGAVASASGWIWTYCVVQVTQPGIDSIGYRYFIVWAVLCFVWIWIVYCKFIVPTYSAIANLPNSLLP